MHTVLIVHASRHGATAGIADRIGEILRADGIDAVVRAASEMPAPGDFDACVVGGAVYMGSWLDEGTRYLDRYAPDLAERPVWLFSSGPLLGSSREAKDPGVDPIENALGPLSGPGSGGRRKIEELAAQIMPRDHRVFAGAFDPADPPRAVSERVVRMLPAAKSVLPPGDFRDWDEIEAWAHEIAGEVRARGSVEVGTPVAVG